MKRESTFVLLPGQFLVAKLSSYPRAVNQEGTLPYTKKKGQCEPPPGQKSLFFSAKNNAKNPGIIITVVFEFISMQHGKPLWINLCVVAWRTLGSKAVLPPSEQTTWRKHTSSEERVLSVGWLSFDVQSDVWSSSVRNWPCVDQRLHVHHVLSYKLTTYIIWFCFIFHSFYRCCVWCHMISYKWRLADSLWKAAEGTNK